jgi:flagellum-specific ATP synthase
MTEHRFLTAIEQADLVVRNGRVTRILPTFVEADGPNAPLGALCEIETRSDRGRSGAMLAEIVGVNPTSVVLAPFDDSQPTFSGARVTARAQGRDSPVGDMFIGRAVDALARPIDGHESIVADAWSPLVRSPTPPLDRTSASAVLETGVRAIDGLLTLGRGQRVGVFAASGVGKSTLMTQFANQIDADRCVICLVGERGREVEALWSRDLSPAAKARSTLVSATSDESAAMRVRACDYALTLADHWRRRGLHVLLLLDSVTRLAMAMREIGLAAGEPPTVRAYTPSVFAAAPKLVERCGALRDGGSITAIMTVLCETDDTDDPVAEMMKSLLDGHIILSRELAEQNHYPAIDLPRSISRMASGLACESQRRDMSNALSLISTYETSRTLIEAGIYVPGASAQIDRALERRPALLDFVRQSPTERTSFAATGERLTQAVGGAA